MTIQAEQTEVDFERQRAFEQEKIAQLVQEYSEYVDTSRWTNIHLNAGGYLQATIPIDQINEHDFPLNKNHSSDLAGQMSKEAEKNGGTGQRLPLDLTTVIGTKGLEIFDGFHRHDGLLQNGVDFVHATLRCGMSEEELIDLRIAATRKYGLELPRTVEMAQTAWKKTPWSPKIDVYQAFNLIANKNRSTGRSYDITKDERDAIEVWVLEKSRVWNLTPEEVHRYLIETSEFDPEIVALMRELGPDKGHGFSPKTARKVVSAFTDKIEGELITDIDMVVLVADTANRLLLSHEESMALSRIVHDAIDYESAVQMIESVDKSVLARIVADNKAKRFGGSRSPKSKPVPATETAIVEPTNANDNQTATPEKPRATNTIEDIVALTPNHDLLDLLDRAITAVRKRYERGDVPNTNYTNLRLRKMSCDIIAMAALDQNEWGVHKGEYSNNRAIHDAIKNICDYLTSGGDKPQLPSPQETHLSFILGGVMKFTKEHIDGKDEQQAKRLDEFKQVWRRRYGA